MTTRNPLIMVVADQTGYFGDVCTGIADARKDYPHIRILNEPSRSNAEHILNIPKGVIIQATVPEIAESWQSPGVPMLNVSNSNPTDSIPLLTSDMNRAGELAAQHFLDRGLSDTAVVYRHGICHSEEKRQGFTECMHKAGGTVHSFRLLGKNTFPYFRPQTDLSNWLHQLPKPCGMLCDDDFIAKCIVDHLDLLKIDVPAELAVLGINDDRLACELAPVPISSVRLNGREIGRQALHWLMQAIDGNRKDALLRRIPPLGVTARASTDVQFSQDPLVSRSLQYIRANLHESLTVEQLCEILHVSRRVLERHFQDTLGRPPYAEITRSRIQRAKELLQDQPGLTIQEVAERCGYNQPNLFYRQFHKQETLSPGEWRKRNKLS